MTTRILAENAYKAARAVYRPAQKVSKTLPVLAYVLIQFHDGNIAMTTTDLLKPTTAYAAARWEGETWSTCVPMRAFKDWLAVVAKSKEVLTLEFDAIRVRLTCTTDPHVTGTRSRTEFLCLDSREFPPVTLQ